MESGSHSCLMIPYNKGEEKANTFVGKAPSTGLTNHRLISPPLKGRGFTATSGNARGACPTVSVPDFLKSLEKDGDFVFRPSGLRARSLCWLPSWGRSSCGRSNRYSWAINLFLRRANCSRLRHGFRLSGYFKFESRICPPLEIGTLVVWPTT